MSLLHYIDNEVAAYGEWDSVVQAGSSTIVQSADAAFPERGALGLRCSTAVGNTAYVQKTAVATLAPGDVLYAGSWLYLQAAPSTLYARVNGIVRSGVDLVWAYVYADGRFRLGYRRDTGPSAGGYASFTGWNYVVVAVKRATTNIASDGWARMYVGGAPASEVSGIDNYDIANGVADFRAGCYSQAQNSMVLDLDEIKIATTYPEPYVPTPLTEYPEARRTVVLFRRGDADSREFADYCVSELDVPRSNLCPLPNATANESLADYATFQTEVETDLAAWLALNPTVEANCSCFLIGHGVPGYFTSGGVKHSATSRLMNYGTAFSSNTANPLYNPATVARLTKTAMGGKYLCTRIDADTLVNAKLIIDRSLTVAALSALPATDILWSDDSAYTASLACQHLRLRFVNYAGYADVSIDAFVWGDTGNPGDVVLGDAGTRAAFCDDSADSADTLRATSELFYAIVTNSYAAGLGFSATPSALLPAPFFEMLRIGGTLAEAFAVAVASLDYTAVGVGSPLMTVAFQLGGYNVYRGVGGIEDIDWDSPVAYLRAGEDNITFGQDLSSGLHYIYALRAVSSAGVQERNTQVITYVQTDEQGNLLPAPLACPTDLAVDVQQSNLLIGFSYYAPLGFAEADGFDILSDNGTGQLDLDNPVATVERSRHGRFDFEASITRPGTPVLLAVRARDDQCTGPISEILFVPLSDAPAPPQIL